MKPFLVLIVIAITQLTSACSDKKQKSATLIAANRLHLESMALHEKLEKELSAFKIDMAKANNTAMIIRTDSLNTLIELWEEAVVEVPGFEHAHQHNDHDHHHKPAIEMTDESILDYQQNAKTAIKEMNVGFKKLLTEQNNRRP